MDDLVTQALLLLFGGALLGGLLGAGFSWLMQRRHGGDQAVPGMALGMAVFAACTLFGALRVGWAAWQQQQGMSEVQGELVGYETETLTDTRNRRTSTVQAPVVRFVAADGRSYQIKGLGGSQPDKSPGTAVPVLYKADDPEVAMVADFQNVWGAVWAFSGFGGFGLLAALFFGGTAWSEARERQQRGRPAPPPSAWARALGAWRVRHGQRLQRAFSGSAGLVFVAGLLVPALDLGGNFGRSMSVGLAGVAVAMLFCMAAVLCSRQASGMALAILGMLATGFSFFAFGLWKLSVA